MLSTVCLAANNEDKRKENKEKFRFYAGIALVAFGLLTFWWTGTAIFFVVFASQGILQIIEYMV